MNLTSICFSTNVTLYAAKEFKSQGGISVVTVRPDPYNAGSNGNTKQNFLHGDCIGVGIEYLTENNNNTGTR